jgi:Na+/H+ antiporter NhaD/arsenite permease-like protein
MTSLPLYTLVPFVSLLLLVAIGPLFFAKFWHKHYPKIAIGLGVAVALYYLAGLQQAFIVAETFAEYVAFISLLLALYMVAGGIYISADYESNKKVNTLLLISGAILANIIGTTGASVLLIRPFMRLNSARLKPYHIVFFIFFVSNLGGLLTPIGDPPLFIGFLKGVPFSFTLNNLWPMWLIAMAYLAVVFNWFESKNKTQQQSTISTYHTNKIQIDGVKNFGWLALIIASVFIDPNTIDGVPYFEIHGKKISYIRELIQLSIATCAYFTNNKQTLLKNNFSFEPIKEVAFLFFGIFLTMMPAIQILDVWAKDVQLSAGTLYWATGIFSSVLDNAPTYLNFFTVAMSMNGLSVNDFAEVKQFVLTNGKLLTEAISVAAVFFGALTYIGNGPNFMVKAIAEEQGVNMPDFFKYIGKYSLPILLPLLLFVWFIFFF